MNVRDEVACRLGLAEGFLNEAEQDVLLERWRSCVDNAQLAVGNSGKAVLAPFGVSPRTHDPARELAALLRRQNLPERLAGAIRSLLPELLALGSAEHFLTDYGDEATYTLPWDLFMRESALDALEAARRCVGIARKITRERLGP